MENNFQIVALDKNQFEHLFNLTETELSKIGIVKMVADKYPGFPCRVSLADAEVGEEVILLNYEHHNVDSPYKSNGPIFIRKVAKTIKSGVNEIPKMFNHRLLSLRGYNGKAIMIFAEVINGEDLKDKLFEILKDENIGYLHIHNARPGCFNCLVKRV